jgi:hypothetical protein
MVSEGSFETFVPIYQPTRRHIPEDRNLHTAIRTLNLAGKIIVYILICFNRYYSEWESGRQITLN